jgi:hypothetical protein
MKKIVLAFLSFATPAFAFAQVTSIQSAGGLIISVINNVLVPLIFALAFLTFIYGVFKYFISGGAEKAKKEGLNLIIYGIIGFAVMVSVFGLVRILTGSVNLNTQPLGFPGSVNTSGY